MSALLAEVLSEIRAAPMHFVADVLQSLLLIALVTWLARRALGRRLHARAERIAAEVQGASDARREAARLVAEAAGVVDAARAAAPGIVQQARDEVERSRGDFVAGVDAEAAAIVDVARRTIAEERARLELRGAERLLAQATELASRYLEEVLNEQERRDVTHRAVQGLLDALSPAPGATADARAGVMRQGDAAGVPAPPPLPAAPRGAPAGSTR